MASYRTTPARPELVEGPQGVASMATAEYHRRRETARRKVAARAMSADQANALVLPWLALACRAGADLPELAGAIDELLQIPATTLSEGEARAIVADSICPLPVLRTTLGAAFGAAAQRAEGDPSAENMARYRALRALAWLVEAPFLPLQPREIVASSSGAIGQQGVFA